MFVDVNEFVSFPLSILFVEAIHTLLHRNMGEENCVWEMEEKL